MIVGVNDATVKSMLNLSDNAAVIPPKKDTTSVGGGIGGGGHGRKLPPDWTFDADDEKPPSFLPGMFLFMYVIWCFV